MSISSDFLFLVLATWQQHLPPKFKQQRIGPNLTFPETSAKSVCKFCCNLPNNLFALSGQKSENSFLDAENNPDDHQNLAHSSQGYILPSWTISAKSTCSSFYNPARKPTDK